MLAYVSRLALASSGCPSVLYHDCICASAAGELGPAIMRPGERALVAAVLGTGAAADELCPALMAAHAAADVVEGLDVDRDDFDKFTYRSSIDTVLMEIWKDESASKAQQAGHCDLQHVNPCHMRLLHLLAILWSY